MKNCLEKNSMITWSKLAQAVGRGAALVESEAVLVWVVHESGIYSQLDSV